MGSASPGFKPRHAYSLIRRHAILRVGEGVADTKRIVDGQQVRIAVPRNVARFDVHLVVNAKGAELIKKTKQRRGSGASIQP